MVQLSNEEIKQLLSDNPIETKKNIKYEFPFGFAIPESHGCSILCRIVLASLIKSLDYSGSLIGITISSVKPIPTNDTHSPKRRNKSKNKSSTPPPLTESKNDDGEIIKFVQIHSSLSTPIEYSLFHQYLNESLKFTENEWILEFENILKNLDDDAVIPKLMIATNAPNDDICGQWIEFISSIVPPLFDYDKDSYVCHHWDDEDATHSIMDQLIRSYNEQDDDDEDDEEEEDDEEKTDKLMVEDLDIGNYVQSIMDHCANIFNFIYGKLSTIYKNVNADSTIIIDCDCNENIGKILKFMKDKYLDPNPQTPSIELYYGDKSSTYGSTKHKYGGRYVQFTHIPPEEFITNSTIRKYRNAYFASIDAHQGNIVHYVLTKNNKAYIINNEKLGVLIWYFLRCMSNHTSISNSIHIFLSVGKDSSSDYLDFLDITKIEIYSHDKKSYNDVMKEYEDECIICIEYKQNGSGCIAFSNNIVEKLEYISDNNADKFIPEDALLDFYRLFESGNNDAIINFLIAQLSLQLFHIGVSEWVDIYDIDLLSLYQHSITVAQQKQNGTYIEPSEQKEDEDGSMDEDEDQEEDEEEMETDEDEEEDDYDDAAEDEHDDTEPEDSEPIQESSSYGENEMTAEEIAAKYNNMNDDDDEDMDDEEKDDNNLDQGVTQTSISPEVSDVESHDGDDVQDTENNAENQENTNEDDDIDITDTAPVQQQADEQNEQNGDEQPQQDEDNADEAVDVTDSKPVEEEQPKEQEPKEEPEEDATNEQNEEDQPEPQEEQKQIEEEKPNEEIQQTYTNTEEESPPKEEPAPQEKPADPEPDPKPEEDNVDNIEYTEPDEQPDKTEEENVNEDTSTKPSKAEPEPEKQPEPEPKPTEEEVKDEQVSEITSEAQSQEAPSQAKEEDTQIATETEPPKEPEPEPPKEPEAEPEPEPEPQKKEENTYEAEPEPPKEPEPEPPKEPEPEPQKKEENTYEAIGNIPNQQTKEESKPTEETKETETIQEPEPEPQPKAVSEPKPKPSAKPSPSPQPTQQTANVSKSKTKSPSPSSTKSKSKEPTPDPKKKPKPKKPDSPSLPNLHQSKSTDADPLSEKKNGHFNESSVDIDSYTNKMSWKQRTELLNTKKKSANKRKQSTTLLKMQEDYKKQGGKANQDPSKQSSIVTMIGGTSNGSMSLRQRALMSFQSKMNNQKKWKQQDDWLKRSQALSNKSKGPPLKSQKSQSVLERMAKFANAQKDADKEETWRKKLADREKKNFAIPSPSHSRSTTADGTILTDSMLIAEATAESPNLSPSNSRPGSPAKKKVNTLSPTHGPTVNKMMKAKSDGSGSAPPPKHHKRHTSASQRAIIARLTASADQWKKKYKKKDHDNTLQNLRKKNPSKQRSDDHQEKMRLQNNRMKKKKKIKTKDPYRNGNKMNDDSKDNTDGANGNVHVTVNSNIDKFLEIADEQKTDANAWKKRLKKESKPQNDHLVLLNLQIRKLNNKMGLISGQKSKERYEKDIVSIEMAFEERLSLYQIELLDTQNRFEAQIAYYKDLRTENDSKSMQAMDAEERKKLQESMEQQVAERKSKIAGKLEDATKEMNRENSFKVLRDLNILIDDDTIIDMNNCDILEKMKDVIKYCIMDNAKLVSIQFANAKLTDELFINNILPIITQNGKILTELILDANSLKDGSIIELTKFVKSNPACLRVLKLANLYNDISTSVITEFLNALDKNSQLIKVVIDLRENEEKDKLQKIMDRNWKRYAQERRLKKTLLTQIQNRKQQKMQSKAKRKNNK